MKARPRPVRDWFMLIVLSSILFIGSLAWNTWFFIRATNGDVAADAGAIEPEVKKNVVESVRALFIERAAEEARYKNEHRFVDPSKSAS